MRYYIVHVDIYDGDQCLGDYMLYCGDEGVIATVGEEVFIANRLGSDYSLDEEGYDSVGRLIKAGRITEVDNEKDWDVLRKYLNQ